MVLPVVAQAFVEGGIFLRSDLLWVAGPQRLRLVELLVFGLDFLHFLCLLLLAIFVVLDFFDLGITLSDLFFVFYLL